MNGRCKCPEPILLRGLLDDSLATVELETITEHVGDCPSCQETLEQLAGDPGLVRCCAAAREQPAEDSAFWPALRSLQQITQPVDRTGRTPLPDPRETAFLDPPTRPGDLGRLGRFEIRRVIGRGGMGLVLHAFDPKLRRDVALKVLDPVLASDEIARQRFTREAQAAALVADDNIVAIHEVDRELDKDLPFLVMQLVEGETLEARLLREKRLPLAEIVRIGAQIASGLAAAHERGLIHRDIKPGNVLLEKGTDRVKLTDFGLARAAEDMRLTRSGLVAGTPLYMAPEQARGEEIDHRADLFSLGVVLYEMATGSPPFTGKTPLAVLRRLADEPHRPIREINPEVPEWLAGLIDRLLAKEPEKRYQTAREVARELEQQYLLMRTTSPDHVVCPRAKVRRKMLKLVAVAGLAGVGLTLAVLAGVWMLGALFRPVEPEPAAIRKTNAPVWALAFSPVADVLAIGQDDGNVLLWAPLSNQVQVTLRAERHLAWVVAMSPDGAYLATAGEEEPAKLWTLETQQARPLDTGAAHSAAFAHDGKTLAVGGRDGTLRFFEVPSGKLLRRIDAHPNGWVSSVSFSPDDSTVATGSTDGEVVLWNTASGMERLRLPFKEKKNIYTVAFSPDGTLLATGGYDKVVRLWDPRSGELVGELVGHTQDVRSLCFCPLGKVLTSGSDDTTVRVWNVAKREERMVLRGHTGPVYAVTLSRDGKLFASGSRDGTVRVYNVPVRCTE